MRGLSSIALFVLAYLLLQGRVEGVPMWLSSFLGVLFIIAAFFTWLFKRREKAFSFRSLHRFGWLQVMFFFCLSGFILTLVYLVLWQGPSLAVDARNTTMTAVGLSNGEFSNQGESLDEGGQVGEPEVVIGNDENTALKIPERGGPKGKRFPEVWIEPSDEKSQRLLNKSPIYITLKNLLDFDGYDSWTVLNARSESFQKSELGWVDLAQSEVGKAVSYTVSHAADCKLLHAVQGVERVKLNSLSNYGGVAYSLPLAREAQERIRTYDCVSAPKRFSAFTEEELKSIRIGEGYEEYARNTFSNTFRNDLVNLANGFKGMGLIQPADKITAIKQYLKTNYRYNLEVENSGDRPPLENFLFHETKGYCLHFASAAVLLLRELGIPSRLSSGYCGGTYFPLKNRWVFYTSNAHAWVEVYLKNHGWVIVEVTPPQGILSGRAAADGEPEDISTVEERELTREGEASVEGLASSIFSEAKGLLFVIGVLLAVLLLIGKFESRGRKRRKGESKEDERQRFEERAYLALYRKMSHLNGLPMMDGDTLLAHISSLEEKELKPDFADTLLEYHYKTTYQNQEQDGAKEAELMKNIRKWKK